MSVADYFGKLQPLWDELATYDPLPSCSCGLCMCHLAEKFQQKQDNDRLHEFLCGIYVEKFGTLRSSLLSQDPRLLLIVLIMLCSRKSNFRLPNLPSGLVAGASGSAGRGRGTLVQAGSVQGGGFAGSAVSSSNVPVGLTDGLSDTQWQKLISLLGNSDINSADKLTDSASECSEDECRDTGVSIEGETGASGASSLGVEEQPAPVLESSLSVKEQPAPVLDGQGPVGDITVGQQHAFSHSGEASAELPAPLSTGDVHVGSGVSDVSMEPKSFKEAMLDPEWRKAMQKEITALEDNGTWSMVELSADKKALGTQWVYKVKYNSDGSIEQFKAQLVVFGNHQVEGIYYKDTFAPVAKMVTVRVFLAIAVVKQWELHQMDVHNAFLHGDLS
ncbi:transmembrane signal receptor [Lithospermum erythrorhizon]|uniref:Transmembrane signal receptor n=1 Tax=Lithospermum erythrorhizon TaxID=34254 RepID=A0AAV3QMK6_LITER